MKISEFAKETGLTADTIRFYEKIGLLDVHHVQRGDNRYRDYRVEALKQVRMIKEAQSAGFTLAEFKELYMIWRTGDEVAQQLTQHVHEKVEAIDLEITKLQRMRSYLMNRLADLEHQGQMALL